MTNRDNSSRPRPGDGRRDVRRTPSGERGRLDDGRDRSIQNRNSSANNGITDRGNSVPPSDSNRRRSNQRRMIEQRSGGNRPQRDLNRHRRGSNQNSQLRPNPHGQRRIRDNNEYVKNADSGYHPVNSVEHEVISQQQSNVMLSNNIPLESRVDIIKPVTFAFGRVFKNPVLWIGYTLLALVLLTIVSLISGGIFSVATFFGASAIPFLAISSAIFALFILFFYMAMYMPLYNQTIKEIDKENPSEKFAFKDFFSDVPYGKAFGTIFAIFIALLLFVLLSMSGIFIGTALSLDDRIVSIIGAFTLITVNLVLIFYIFPIIFLVPYYVYDNKASVIGSFKKASNDFKAHYFKALVSFIVVGIVGALPSVVPVIGTLVSIPVIALGYAHIYRQISGDFAPVE